MRTDVVRCRVSGPTKKLGFNTFRCAACKAQAHIGLYAIAQICMGHALTHTCGCGQRHRVESGVRRNSYKVTAAIATPKDSQ